MYITYYHTDTTWTKTYMRNALHRLLNTFNPTSSNSNSSPIWATKGNYSHTSTMSSHTYTNK